MTKKTEVFISYSHHDKKIITELADKLQKDKIAVWLDMSKLAVGDNIAEMIKSAISRTDYFIVALSKSSLKSHWVNFELSATILNEISSRKTIILPILLEDCEIPFFLQNRIYADFRSNFDDGYEKLLSTIKSSNVKSPEYISTPKKFEPENYEQQIKSLTQAYNAGNLTLFCGAGISYDAGIPTWNSLLKALLKVVYSDNEEIPDIDGKLASLFQKRINVSPLILAQYLKILLGKKFATTVRDILYNTCTDKSKTIDAICELSRPQRDRKSLRAIITFNFDDLIETKLASDRILFKSIFTEGERYSEREIPIFHPHGFLPRDKKITNKNDIVFSEDAYHSQFIDSFSWSNLIQLNHLNNYTCLFIGISLTDPNMRRLIDVSMRKNGKGEKNHYIIKKHYTLQDLYPNIDISKSKDEKVIPIIESIEEQDANNLGFNVIWINDFREIPSLLSEIGK